MKKNMYDEQGLIRFLYDYWLTYCLLNDSHWQWLVQHVQVIGPIKAEETLFEPGNSRNYLYFVVKGLLAGTWWDEENGRHLIRLAPPLFSILSTQNLHTDTQNIFSIIALRNSYVLRIPIAALRDYQNQCAEASVLVHVLREKKLKQLAALSWLMSIKNEQKRYEAFFKLGKKNKLMRWLLSNTTQQEQQEYLNISESSITRARRGKR